MKHWGVPEVIVLDEIHHPTTENFVIFMLLRHAVHTLKMPIKVFVSSATLNSDTLCRVSENKLWWTPGPAHAA
jgi:HrpA-like RNA helicase